MPPDVGCVLHSSSYQNDKRSVLGNYGTMGEYPKKYEFKKKKKKILGNKKPPNLEARASG